MYILILIQYNLNQFQMLDFNIVSFKLNFFITISVFSEKIIAKSL